jgi:glyoxylase-like metal-dependent hydrolase (beta-lactamase superfamily II)
MYNLSRRHFFLSAAMASAAFGLNSKLFIPSALAGTGIDPEQGVYKYNVGTIEVTALYDGIWQKPHDPAFIKNASVADTKEALAKAGLTTEYMPIPLTVVVLNLGDRLIMIDSGSGAQWQPTAGRLHENMAKAGIDADKIGTILISHFHPDHIFGLMHKGTNEPFFPKAELIVNATEYKWWTEPGRVEKLPEARKALGKRVNDVFPKWKNFTFIDKDSEVAPGIELVKAPGHTPGHSVFIVSSDNEQLMISNDTAYVPALLAPHPDWQGAYDQDGPTAVTTRKKIIDRVIADKMKVCGAHFPFPGAGTFVKDGDAYAFTPVES